VVVARQAINKTYMKSLLKITLITVLILTVSCQREKLSTQSVVETETAQQAYTDLDKWIETNITLPYGIAVEYRWDKNTAPKGTYTYLYINKAATN